MHDTWHSTEAALETSRKKTKLSTTGMETSEEKNDTRFPTSHDIQNSIIGGLKT